MKKEKNKSQIHKIKKSLKMYALLHRNLTSQRKI